MRKNLFVLMIFISLGIFASCNNDDDKVETPSIVGKWYFYAYTADESTDLYYYTIGCESKRDYYEFKANNTTETAFYNENCQEFKSEYTWTKEGNIVTWGYDGYYNDYTIEELTNTTLKFKYVDSNDYIIFKK